ncbi:MAG: DUF4097 domain-containing protein [Clostridiales bacterium]|jgi:DUF4097 and DUF4098 domain-containing protein YvlB|nr:DUF4097 domain-containing protein [Clostridiales bacterium]
MKTAWKIAIIVTALGLILITIAVFTGASRLVYWDTNGPHVINSDYENEKRITELDLEPFENIEIRADFLDVETITSDRYGIDVCYFEGDLTWSLNKGNLIIDFKPKKNIHFFNFSFGSVELQNYIKVYLPKDAELGTFFAKTDMGKIEAGEIRANEVQIINSFGDLDIYSITCNRLQIEMDAGGFSAKNLSVTGDIKYKNNFGASRFETVSATNFVLNSDAGEVSVNGCSAQSIDAKSGFGSSRFDNTNANSFVLNSDAGEVTINGCQAKSIEIKSNFGRINAKNLVSAKTDIKSDAGEIDVAGEFLGQTVIKSEFGNISFATEKAKEDYTYDIYAGFGSVTLDNNFDNNRVRNSAYGGNSAENSLSITSSAGDIQIYFTK